MTARAEVHSVKMVGLDLVLELLDELLHALRIVGILLDLFVHGRVMVGRARMQEANVARHSREACTHNAVDDFGTLSNDRAQR